MSSSQPVSYAPLAEAQPRSLAKWVVGIFAAVLIVVAVIAVATTSHTSSSGSSRDVAPTTLYYGFPAGATHGAKVPAGAQYVCYNEGDYRYVTKPGPCNKYYLEFVCGAFDIPTPGYGCYGYGNTYAYVAAVAAVTYPAPINSGTCSSHGWEPITDPAECLAAAKYNGDTLKGANGKIYDSEFTVYETETPPGCWPAPAAVQPNIGQLTNKEIPALVTGNQLCVNSLTSSTTNCDGANCLCKYSTTPPPPPGGSFALVTSGTCGSSGYTTITDPTLCLQASASLNAEITSAYAADGGAGGPFNYSSDLGIPDSSVTFDSLNSVNEPNGIGGPTGCWPMPGQNGIPGSGLVGPNSVLGAPGTGNPPAPYFTSLNLCLNVAASSTECGAGPNGWFGCLCQK